jgi:hypothetical protein
LAVRRALVRINNKAFWDDTFHLIWELMRSCTY